METKLYLITPQTNMHVGSGDIKYGIIDKYVQRDVKTELPIINSSSLKGGIREFMEEEIGWAKDGMKVKHIFGGHAKGGNENSSSGKYRFFTSELLAIPVRCLEKPYFLATSPSILKSFVDRVSKMGGQIHNLLGNNDEMLNLSPQKGTPITFNGVYTLEDYRSQQVQQVEEVNKLLESLGTNVAIFHDEDFKEIISDLPVVARNHLEDGISDNLWYEEIVPHHTVFYTFIGIPNSDSHFPEFNSKLTSVLVQIGANASIGYGFCEFKHLNISENE